MWVVVAAMAASTAVSAYGQVQSGKAQQSEFERQAEEEKIAAEGRELQRKQELNINPKSTHHFPVRSTRAD